MKHKLLLLLLIIILLTGCAKTEDEMPRESTPSTETEVQEPYILTFNATTIDGEPVTSDIFADSKLTMINVWATYCNPCISEMPDLGEIATEYDPETFQIIGIISDVIEGDEASPLEDAKALIAQTGANYPHLLLNQSLYSNLVGGINAVPTTFFINQKGELLGYLQSAQSKEVWLELIESLLSDME